MTRSTPTQQKRTPHESPSRSPITPPEPRLRVIRLTREELREIRFQMIEGERGFGHAPDWHSAMRKIDAALTDPERESS